MLLCIMFMIWSCFAAGSVIIGFERTLQDNGNALAVVEGETLELCVVLLSGTLSFQVEIQIFTPNSSKNYDLLKLVRYYFTPCHHCRSTILYHPCTCGDGKLSCSVPGQKHHTIMLQHHSYWWRGWWGLSNWIDHHQNRWVWDSTH